MAILRYTSSCVASPTVTVVLMFHLKEHNNALLENDCHSLTFLKPTAHVMHHQFNIPQLYALPTLYLCVLYLSENKQRLVPLTYSIN
jgi:hypothetical protein